MMSPVTPYSVENADINHRNLIVGVYSSNPAIIGNSTAEKNPDNSVLVGMIGVIKTKVNTENGLVKIGDYITISSVPGVGMKATESGMVVGRAMENYSGSGTGLINVMVQINWVYRTDNGNITGNDIKNVLKKQQNDIDKLKTEIEQSKSSIGITIK